MLFPTIGYGNDQSAIKSTAGPLCNSVDDVKLYCESIWKESFFSQNADVPPIKFRSDVYSQVLKKKIKFGYLCYRNANSKLLYGLESLPVSRATSRALQMTIDKLRGLGHEFVPFEVTYEEFSELDLCYIAFTRHAIMTGMRELQKY